MSHSIMDFLGLYLLQLALIGKLNITYFSVVELLQYECVDLRMAAAARISLSFMPSSASLTIAFYRSCLMKYVLFSSKISQLGLM